MEDSVCIEVLVQIRIGKVFRNFFGYRCQIKIEVFLDFAKEHFYFSSYIFFIGRQRFFRFGSFGQLFHQVTFSVTAHLRFGFVFTKGFRNIFVIDHILKNRQYRFKEDKKNEYYNSFFHVAKVTPKNGNSKKYPALF